jgi:hypothetical protein
MSGVLRRLALIVLLCGAVLAVAGTADAHDPIILTPQQTSPAAGPLILDGTVSFALYGTLLTGNDHRGFRARFRAGDLITVTLLLPDLAPENELTDAQRPGLTMTAPDGTSAPIQPGEVSRFTESFTGTKYIQYVSLKGPAVAGDYGFTVAGLVPARFTVAIGVTEQFGTPVNDISNRSVGVAGVKEWYATAPPALVAATDPTTTVGPTTTVDPTTTVPDTVDVVEETVPAVGKEGSPKTAVVIGAGAVAIIGLGVGLSRRRRR